LVIASCCVILKVAAICGGIYLPMILVLAASGAAIHTGWLFLAQEIELHSRRREVFERLLSNPVGAEAGAGVRRANFPVAGKRLRLVADLPAGGERASWQPRVSIIIPAKNEESVIGKTVRQTFKLDYPEYEVIVIDDASDDDTANVLKQLQLEFGRLQILRLEKGHPAGKSYVLNEALKHCTGEVVAVFDADAFVQPSFLTDMVAQLEPADVAAVQAQKRISNAQHSLLTQWQDFEYAFDTSLQSGRNTVGGVAELRGNGQLVKVAALKAVGGWNNESITDDLDLTMRLLTKGWRVEFTSRAVVWEEGITNVRGLVRQRVRWAEGSTRRFLDYMVPLFRAGVLSKSQRMDLIGFMIEFIWPFLTAFAMLNEIGNAVSGEQTCLRLLIASMMTGGLGVTAYIFWSLRTHRPPMSVWQAAKNACSTSTYFFALWCPCILMGLFKILTQKRASAWALTEHRGHPSA
jgi:1,2-diacylglycerol 3-beta-glucosyltransferase